MEFLWQHSEENGHSLVDMGLHYEEIHGSPVSQKCEGESDERIYYRMFFGFTLSIKLKIIEAMIANKKDTKDYFT